MHSHRILSYTENDGHRRQDTNEAQAKSLIPQGSAFGGIFKASNRITDTMIEAPGDVW